MIKRLWIKQTALILIPVYLFLSGFMMIGMGEHALKHESHAHDGRHARHPVQHSSLICSWMCAASTFAHSSDQGLDPRFTYTLLNRIVSGERIFSPLSIFSFHVRPPPFLPS
jgi:hypothetical protein